MADTERTDYAQKDMDVLLKELKAGGTTLDARKALELLVERLKHSTGYYTWAPLGDGSDATWLLRIPREDLSDEPWLKDESADLIHACRPVQYLESIEARDKDGSADYVGYVRDEDNKLEEKETFHCTKCKRKMPEDSAKKGHVQIKLHALGRKR